MAISVAALVETANNSRLPQIFSNKVIRRCPAFEDVHSMKECINQIVSYFRHAAEGLDGEEANPLTARPRRRR